ncbi:MAG TPA: hypothetical protein GX513_06920 [Firmicutes bacterium]|nr:hypothetical protein [Bacillota bacterium]
MRKKFGMAVLVTLFALAFLLGGCGGKPATQEPAPPQPEAVQGGAVTIAQWSEPGNLNPLIWPTTYDTNITQLVFDGLVKPNEKLELVGDLAEKWEFSQDRKTVTFHLRKGVKWHDGQPFTANDVAFTLKSLADPNYDGGSYSRVEPILGAAEYHDGKAKDIEGIKVIDQETICITTKDVYSPILAALSIAIVPEHILKNVPIANWQKDQFNRQPVGTGPFKFVKWESGQYVELEANKDYFEGAPKIDRIVFKFGDQNTMLAAFLNKEVDVCQVPVGEVDSVKGLDWADLVVFDSLSFQYVGLNLLNPALADPNVRQALAQAVNREQIVKSLLRGYGKITNVPFPTSHWSYDPSFPGWAYDPAKAKELLDAAGWKLNEKTGIREKDGQQLKFTLYYPTGNLVRMQYAPILQQNFQAIGVKLELQAMDFPTLVTKLLPRDASGKMRPNKASDFDMFLLGFGVELDPDEYRPYFHSAYRPPKGYNFCSYVDPEMDRLLEDSVKEVDQGKRADLFHQIGRKLGQDLPWIPMYTDQELYVVNKHLHNFKPGIHGLSRNVLEWYLTK